MLESFSRLWGTKVPSTPVGSSRAHVPCAHEAVPQAACAERDSSDSADGAVGQGTAGCGRVLRRQQAQGSMGAHDAMPQHEAVSLPAGAVDEGDSGYSADGACADSVEWLLAEMLRGSTVAEEGLPQRLRREGFWEALGSEARALRSVSSADCEGLLKAMWRHVRKFSVGRCNMLLAESRKAAVQAAADGHDVTVALGYTGAGKTTLMHVLRGSSFKVDECGRLHAVSDASGLRVGDNDGRSETRFVRLVKDMEGRLLADSPGFQDTDGPEVEVANVLGVAEFLQACRSVRLVVVVNAEGFGNKGQGLRLLAGMLGSLLRDPAAAMRSTTFLYTKEQDITHQAMYKKVCDVHKVAVEEDDKTIQGILGELRRQAVHPALRVLDSDEGFEEDGLEDAADGKAVLLRPCGGDRYDLVYGEHGTEHRTTVSLPHIEPGSRLKLDQTLRGELVAAVEAAGAPPLFLGACVSVRPLDPACAGRVLRAVQARPAVEAPCNVFGREAGLRQETTLAVREQALVDVKSIQSSVAYCAGLAGGGGACTGAQQEGVQGAPAEEGGAQQEAAAVWRIVGWRLERLAATYELLQDDHVGRALQEAQRVVRTSLLQRLDDAVHHVARVAGPDARLTEDDTQQVQRAIDGIAAARMVVEKLVPDVPWGVLGEKVRWHLREYGRVAHAALRENKPQEAGVALQQLQLLAEQTCVAVSSGGCSAADVRDAAVRCGRQHFDGLCAAVQQRIKEGALHSTEALQGTATALSDMCVHHKHLHAVLHLGDLDSTAYTPAVEALRDGLAGLTAACARDADELAQLQVRDDAQQQQLVAQLRDRLAVLSEAEAVCSQHSDVSVLHAFVRGAQGACVAAVDTLCGRAERAVKGAGGGMGTSTAGDADAGADAVTRTQQDGEVQTHAQEMQGDDAQLCLDIVEEVRQVDCGVTAESLGRYTEMQARVNAAAAVAVTEVRRQLDIIVARTAGVGPVQRDQAAVLVQYIEQLQRQPALSRYSQEGQGLVAATQQACRERVGRELQRLGQEALPVCGSADELLAYCMRLSGVMAVVPLGQVLPDMHGMLAAAEAAHTRCVQQRLACLEAVLEVPPTVTALQAEPLPAQGEEGVVVDDSDLIRFAAMLQQRKQAAARGGAPPPCTLADLLAALARVGEVRRVVHGAAGQAAQRVEAGLRDYIHGGATVQDTYAAAVCASLEKSVQAIAGVCDDLELADAKAGGGEAQGLIEHVKAVCKGMTCLAEVEAAATQGADRGSDAVRTWQARLHTQVVQVLDQWLAVGDAHVTDVQAMVQYLHPLDQHTDGAVVTLKNNCREKFLKLFHCDDPVLQDAVKTVDAQCVRQRLNFLHASKQGTQAYKRLRRIWRERVQQLINFRLPAGSTDFEECAARLREIHEHATEVLSHFAGDEGSQHLGDAMLHDLAKCKEAAAGPQLVDRLKKSLLQPLEDAVRNRRFNDAKQLLQQVEEAEDTLSQVPDARAAIDNVRDLHSKELDALQAEYRDWDVADTNSPALLNLARVLQKCDECGDVAQAIRSEVDNKVRVYVRKQRDAVKEHHSSLSHLEMSLPRESAARRDIIALKEQMVAKVKDDCGTCKMHIDIGDYKTTVEYYNKHPRDHDMRLLMRTLVTKVASDCNAAVKDINIIAVVQHLDQLDRLAVHLPDLCTNMQLRDDVANMMHGSIRRVAQTLVTGTASSPDDVRVVAAAYKESTLWQLVGDDAKQQVECFRRELSQLHVTLDTALRAGAEDEVRRLLDVVRVSSDLCTALGCDDAAGGDSNITTSTYQATAACTAVTPGSSGAKADPDSVVQHFTQAVQDSNMEAAIRHLGELDNLLDPGDALRTLKDVIVQAVHSSIGRVAQNLVTGTPSSPDDVRVVAAAFKEDAIWQLVGDGAKQQLLEVTGCLLSHQTQLAQDLSDTDPGEVARLLGVVQIHADLLAVLELDSVVFRTDAFRMDVQT